jgi:ABC-type glutathione transport system ATPase component
VRLEVEGLRVAFGDRMVADVPELAIGEGEIVGLVGESGSGKSMTALAVIGLARGMGATVTGSVRLDGAELLTLPESRMRAIRGRRVAMIFQAPISSLNPVFRVGDVFLRALRLHGASSGEARDRAKAAMREVLLSPELLRRYPNQLSGGQAQRVAIAMAVALRAEVLLADEPTSALDVTVQAEVLDVLRTLQAEEGMSILFVSHDLAVVSTLCSRVAVMRRGEVVEAGAVEDVLRAPAHAYTRELIAAVPRLGEGAAGA